MVLPGLGFLLFWSLWNVGQFIFLNYKDEDSYKIEVYESDKKLSAFPINIR